MKRKIKALHERIADNLKQMILTGRLKEGDKIREDDLCTSMDVSKTPLREALRVLSAQGFITLIPNRGAFVAAPTFEEIRDMFDVMSVLEGLCAQAAAQKMNDKDFTRLEKLHDRLEESFKSGDPKRYVQDNNIYHTFVQTLAGNEILNQIISGLRQRILLYRLQSLNLHDRMNESIREHRELLEAFRKRDAGEAESLMRSHLNRQFEALESLKKLKEAESGEKDSPNK